MLLYRYNLISLHADILPFLMADNILQIFTATCTIQPREGERCHRKWGLLVMTRRPYQTKTSASVSASEFRKR